MTLRSRLSAAWKAFKRDDFPPTGLAQNAGYCQHCLANGYVNDDHCPARDKRDDFPPTIAEAKASTDEWNRRAIMLAFVRGYLTRPQADAAAAEVGIELYPSVDRSVRLDLKGNTTYHVHPPVDMSPHPLPTIVDETDAIRAEEQRELSKLTPGFSNVEVPAVIRRRRKKLESVKK